MANMEQLIKAIEIDPENSLNLPGLSDEELTRLEEALRVKLPGSFKALQQHFNGGLINQTTEVLSGADRGENPSSLTINQARDQTPNMPPGFIPVAHAFGGFVCLDTKKPTPPDEYKVVNFQDGTGQVELMANNFPDALEQIVLNS